LPHLTLISKVHVVLLDNYGFCNGSTFFLSKRNKSNNIAVDFLTHTPAYCSFVVAKLFFYS
jgi:hypothetical protein